MKKVIVLSAMLGLAACAPKEAPKPAMDSAAAAPAAAPATTAPAAMDTAKMDTTKKTPAAH